MMRPTLKKKLIYSFWNTVIQFASDSTRNIHDFLRIGRALWPRFTIHLHPNRIRQTMEGIIQRVGGRDDINKLEDELVSLLGTKFYSEIASLSTLGDGLLLLPLNETGISSMISNSSKNLQQRSQNNDHHMYMRNCLLLASFICQHNKANKDQKVFGTRSNGQRRKSNSMEDIYGGNDEELAFASSSASSTTTATRSFVLERVFSIFVTLVHFNSTTVEEDDMDVLMNRLGATVETHLSNLIDQGYLHPTNYTGGSVKGEQVNLTTARFWCSLTHEDAQEISKENGIPLDQYLM